MYRFSMFLLCALALTISSAQTSGPIVWKRADIRSGITTPGGAPFENYKDVKALSSGNTIALGETGGVGAAIGGDIVLRKHSASSGAILFERFIDGYLAGYSDKAVKLLVAEPFIYVVMNSTYNLTPFDQDIFVYKLDTSLNTVWVRNLNTSGNPDDIAVDAGLDQLGNLYVVGNTTRTGTGGDIVWLKYSSSGSLLFTKYYTSAGLFTDEVRAMAVEPNGVCNITGFYTSSTLGSRMLALKLWSNGIQLWVRYHDVVSGAVSGDIGNSVSYDPVTGDMYVCGGGRNSTGNDDWVVVKFAGSDGTKLWFKRHTGVGNANDNGVKVIYQGGDLYSCGTFTSTVSGVTSKNIQLRKYIPADGASVWTKTYNMLNGTSGPSDESASTMIVSPGGNIYVGGTAVLPTSSAPQTYQVILNYSSSGTLVWAHNEGNTGLSSPFQGIGLSALDYAPGQNALYAAGFEWKSMSVQSSTTLLKFGPTSLAPPLADRSDVDDQNPLAAIDMQVYPNPFSEQAFIEFTTSSDMSAATLQVFSSEGRKVLDVYAGELSPQERYSFRIDASVLPAGIYFCRLSYDGQAINKRVLVVK